MKQKIKNARRLAELLDAQFKIGPFSFGIDPIIGLVPGLGDIIPTIAALYIVLVGLEMNLPRTIIFKMLVNIGVDFLLGLIPILGDFSDVVFKANKRNLEILEGYA